MFQPFFCFARTDEEAAARLAEPFAGCDVKKGHQGLFAQARVYMNRFDEVFGPQNWEVSYEVAPDESVWCTITARWPSGAVTRKKDTGDCKDMHSEEDTGKGVSSDAFKRASVMYGVGRYLYRNGLPGYVVLPDGFSPQEYVPVGWMLSHPASDQAKAWVRDRAEGFVAKSSSLGAKEELVRALGVQEFLEEGLREHLGNPLIFWGVLANALAEDRKAVDVAAGKILKRLWSEKVEALAEKAKPEPATA